MFKNIMYAFLALGMLFTTMMPVRADDVPDNAFYLYNDSSQALHFSFKCSDNSSGPWNRELAHGQAKWYWANNGCDEYIIEKSTDYDDSSSRTLRYTLTAGHKYKLIWNDDDKVWDVNEL